MKRWTHVTLSLLLAGALALGCSDDTDNDADAGLADLGLTADTGPKPDKAGSKPTSFKVGAIQYTKGDFIAASGCFDDLCGLGFFIKKAAKEGAMLVVLPEYSLSQKTAEQAPNIGDKPATDAKWKSAKFLPGFAKLADEQNLTVVVNLITQVGSGSAAKLYNTNVALDKDGKVIGRHYKFQLFSNEASQLTAGPDLKTTFFDTPAGKAGMLICADAQCIVTGLNTSVDCSAHSVKLLKEYFMQQKPKLVLFSAAWTIPSGSTWGSLDVQKKIAKDGNVWLVGAGNTKSGGPGGGVWKPGGTPVKTTTASVPSVIYAVLPLKK